MLYRSQHVLAVIVRSRDHSHRPSILNEKRLGEASKMQSDDVIWSVINTQFCSYKVKSVRLLIIPVSGLDRHQNYDAELLS